MATHRRFPQPGPAARTSRVTVLSAVAAATAALSGGTVQVAAAGPAGGPPDHGAFRADHTDHTRRADPADRTELTDRLDVLYQQAEQATEKYDAARERTRRLRDELGTLQDRAARGQQRVNALRDELGALAAAQYRDGGLGPAVDLLLSGDPDTYLDRAAALDRLGGREADRLRRFRDAQKELRRHRARAAGKLTDLERAGAVLRDRKRTVQRALAEAHRVLAALPAPQRAAYVPGAPGRASRDRATVHIAEQPAVSGRAALAVAAVRQTIGAPYVWGATGPNAFDCSGLMQYAYGRAGVALPRTSQEQLHAGRQVPLARARPGDLVIYRSDASHVGMYVGGGRVVHAPYPGARVRSDPVDMMPVTAVTRP